MKKYVAFILVLALSALLFACGDSDKKTERETVLLETGGTPSESYKYSELPEGYTPEQALKDGCLVLQWEEGSETPRVRGYDYWEYFLNTCKKGEKISLRVVYFNSARCWFSDVYYSHDQYSIYTKDVYSENQIGPYKYLTKIEGEDIYSGEYVSCYILTDDPRLGSEEVLSMTHICDIEAERDVTFKIIDFTTYFG